MFDNWPDFDKLMHLAKTDPQKLDKMLAEKVDALIDSAPERMRNRLRGLQFEIDCHRKIQKNSFDACRKISEMMQDSLRELNFALNTPYNERKEQEPKQTKAKVLALSAVS